MAPRFAAVKPPNGNGQAVTRMAGTFELETRVPGDPSSQRQLCSA
jgi:hypothetical protein